MAIDYCTYDGACRLLGKIRKARALQGEPCDLVVTTVANFHRKPIYGIRPIGATWGRVAPTNGKRGVDNAQVVAECNRVLKAFPGITIDLILAGSQSTPISRARRACILACHVAGLAPDNVALARFFRVDEKTVRRALAAQQVAA